MASIWSSTRSFEKLSGPISGSSVWCACALAAMLARMKAKSMIGTCTHFAPGISGSGDERISLSSRISRISAT